MRFGKIQYLNLIPFDVFLKSYPIPTRYKSAAFANRSYPSKLESVLFVSPHLMRASSLLSLELPPTASTKPRKQVSSQKVRYGVC